jgi:hypothetical protein
VFANGYAATPGNGLSVTEQALVRALVNAIVAELRSDLGKTDSEDGRDDGKVVTASVVGTNVVDDSTLQS